MSEHQRERDDMPEVRAIERQQRRFSRLSLMAIAVSFIHMASALALFSGAAWYEVGAALAMTGLVDVATWALAGYFDYAARHQLSRSGWIKTTFGFALAISMFLNGAYLYANRPATLPSWMSIGTAIVFAVFVPMLIGVASLIRGELEDDRVRLEHEQGSRAMNVTPVIKSAPRPALPRGAPRRAALPVTNDTAPANVTTNDANDAPAPTNAANDARTPANVATNTREKSANGVRTPANDKSSIATNDVTAIVAALRAANVRRFERARTLAKVCGWSSSSSGPKALKHLLEAGAVREEAGAFIVVPSEEERLSK